MKIRFGTYTFYKGIEMNISNYYGHGLTQEIDEKHRIISYPIEYGYIEGFSLDENNDFYSKDVLISDIKNAFFISTKVLFKQKEYNIWAFNIKTKKITIYTTDEELGEKSGFIKLSDRYIYEIEINEAMKIWEERTISEYNLPMPEGLELIKELVIPKNI